MGCRYAARYGRRGRTRAALFQRMRKHFAQNTPQLVKLGARRAEGRVSEGGRMDVVNRQWRAGDGRRDDVHAGADQGVGMALKCLSRRTRFMLPEHALVNHVAREVREDS